MPHHGWARDKTCGFPLDDRRGRNTSESGKLDRFKKKKEKIKEKAKEKKRSGGGAKNRKNKP